MIAYRVPALALAAMLAASAAYAQTPPASPPGGMGHTWGAGSEARHAAHEAAHLKALHDVLNIRPDQEGAFQAFAASMRPAEGSQKPEGMERGSHAMAGMTTPERLDAMSRMMDDHMARMRERFQRHATAVKALYAALSPEQRRTLDALPGLMGHGMGGGGIGMGPRDHMDHPGDHQGMDHPGQGN